MKNESSSPRAGAGKLGVRLAFWQDGQKTIIFLPADVWREVFGETRTVRPAMDGPDGFPYQMDSDDTRWVSIRCSI